MKELIRKIRNNTMRLKFYMHRTSSYLALINTGMILFLFLTKLKEKDLILFDIEKYFFVIFVIGFVLLILVGWFEIGVLKGNQEEAKVQFNLNPEMVEMKKMVKELWEREKNN